MFELLHVLIVIVFLLDGITSNSNSFSDYQCSYSASLCSNGERIEYPFYSEESSKLSRYEYDCGYPGLSAKCSEGGRPFITLSNHSYYYQRTSDVAVRLVDIDLEDQTCPKPKHNFSLEGRLASSLRLGDQTSYITLFYNCTALPKDVSPNLRCIDGFNESSLEDYLHFNPPRRSFAISTSGIPKGFNWYGNCQESVSIPVSVTSYTMIDGGGLVYTEEIKSGIELRLQPNKRCRNCEKSGGKCLYKKNSNNFMCHCEYAMFHKRCPPNGIIIKLAIGLSVGVGVSLFILHFIYTGRYSNTSPTNVEVFLQSYKFHVLQRFKYSDIKKMTNSFKDILGQGGFGLVFKGKLPNGIMVAVKLLNESKGDGEEFINEVTTIGRTNHVNIVTLLGFCINKKKRALVYEFMVNGSLENFIYKEKSSSVAYAPTLGWDKLHQIALGIARGLEYLHRGCNNRILHFDIKPHNILLDSEFIPKISDFGLAKLSQTRDSVVSMVGTRGTNGYIAPELYCRNFGAVSYKSDVYSYGMMLFEVIGGRKNIDATVENISEIYFPHWIYNHLTKEKKIEGYEDMEIDVSEDILHNEIAKKMIIVALWCIQAHPNDRPSMKMVCEMLEATNDKLQMPPNPSLHSSSSISPLLS